MAKDKEKQNNQPVAITVDNVVEQAKQGNTITPDLTAKMQEELKDEKDKRIIREVKSRFQKIAYNVAIGLVNVRKARRMEATALYNIRQQGRLQRLLCGFTVTEQVVEEFAKTPDNILELEVLNEKDKSLTIKVLKEDGKTREEKTFKIGDVVPATIDYTEFDKGLSKLEEKLRSQIKETEDLFKDEVKTIQQAAGEYWRSDWVYDIRVVTPDGLSGRY